ncbi:MAG TPA: branched-chain amino acid ABC transporter substrate-binding protein, partial [Casimicrobiaceae bacterium]|nr:branched-chain amino acid ABC transporter substrate-binding protein [Casimicrobiaceae bacterium]
MRPIHTIGVTLVTAAIVGMYGCGKEEPKQAAAPKTETAATPAPAAAPADETITVKIGSAGPLTGEIAHLGKDNDNGVRLAIDQANE